jgi:hypothetical protein
MSNDRYLLLASGLALVWCVGFASYGRSPIDSLTHKSAQTMLERARRAEHQVELVVRTGDGETVDNAGSNDAATQLVIAGMTAAIRPSPRDRKLFGIAVQNSLIQQWVEPYLALNDYDGAVHGITRGYLNVLERAHQVQPLPRPAPILGPSTKNQTPNVYITAHWGWPLALAVALLGGWVIRVGARLPTAHVERSEK